MEKVKYVRGKAGRGFFLSKTEIVMFVMLDYPIIDIEKKKKIRKEGTKVFLLRWVQIFFQ